jgi:hypothetical protein
MNNLAKVEEEQHKTDTYLMQSKKAQGKDGNFIIHPRLLLETTMMKSLTETVLIIYQLETQYMKVFSKNAADRFPTGINIVGFSQKISSAFISYLKYDINRLFVQCCV